MPPGLGSSRRSLSSTNTEPRIGRTQSQPALIHPTQTSNISTDVSNAASAPSRKRVRGPTMGKRIEKLFQRSGKLPVEVPADCNVPVVPNATSLSSELGKEIRGAAPLQGVNSWLDIDISLRAAVIQ